MLEKTSKGEEAFVGVVGLRVSQDSHREKEREREREREREKKREREVAVEGMLLTKKADEERQCC